MAGDWSSLPSDILACISGILTTDADLLHIHQVCVHWRASTPPAAFRPWLIAGESPPNKTIPIGKYSIHAGCSGRRVLDVGAPAGLPYCLGAPRGWLALTDDERSPTRLVLWDPVSKAEIPLPPLDYVTRIFLSDDPVDAASSWTAIAFQMDDQEDGHKVLRLLVWRPAGDGDAANNWTLLHHRFARRIETVAFKGTKMYCTDGIHSILRCDLRTGYTRTFTVDGAVERLRAGSSDGDWCGSMLGSHMVSCNGEVDMIVLMHVACRRPRAEVCRLRRSTAPRRRLTLPGHHFVEIGERVTDLGDYSLFLGRGDGFALSAKEFPAIKRNRIYYVAGEEIRLFGEKHWALVFDLELDVVEVIYADEFGEDRGSWWPYGWFCPRKALLASTS